MRDGRLLAVHQVKSLLHRRYSKHTVELGLVLQALKPSTGRIEIGGSL